jgi:hypothetical protein
MNTWAKWVYSHKKLAVQFLNMEYLNFWAGDFAPILVNLLGTCVAACSKNYAPMLLSSCSLKSRVVRNWFEPYSDFEPKHIYVDKKSDLHG